MRLSSDNPAVGKRSGGRTSATVLGVLLIVGAASCWSLSGSRVVQVATNADTTYRIEFVSPNHLQRLLHMGMEDAGFVRLYSILDNRLIGTSQFADFFGGNARVTWLLESTGQVSVGRDIMFWHVHPISPSGAQLPIQHEVSP